MITSEVQEGLKGSVASGVRTGLSSVEGPVNRSIDTSVVQEPLG